MPSPENKPGENKPGDDKRRRRRPTLENPMQFPVAGTFSGAPPDTPVPEISDAALGQAAPPSPKRRWSRRYAWFLTALLLLAAVPLGLTLIGAWTSPPHVTGIPSGHLVYLEADAPSEKTTTLRGLYVTEPGQGTRLLVHENEPQDVDGGVREWITQPVISPDGTRIAFEKQLIALLEDKQTIENQIWVMPLAASPAPGGIAQTPHPVLDLTKQNLKQVVGMAWDSDSSLLLLEDGIAYSVPTEEPDPPLPTPLDLNGLTPATAPAVSATRAPVLSESGVFVYGVQTPTGPQVLVRGQNGVTRGPAASLFALSPDGDKIAFVPPGREKVIGVFNIATGKNDADIPVRWGWSVFGRRHITSLRWSPDGSLLAFTVSKPPVPDDELFYVDQGGKTWQLPYRTGRAAWDWSR